MEIRAGPKSFREGAEPLSIQVMVACLPPENVVEAMGAVIYYKI
jgi:hypothetical protein